MTKYRTVIKFLLLISCVVLAIVAVFFGELTDLLVSFLGEKSFVFFNIENNTKICSLFESNKTGSENKTDKEEGKSNFLFLEYVCVFTGVIIIGKSVFELIFGKFKANNLFFLTYIFFNSGLLNNIYKGLLFILQIFFK